MPVKTEERRIVDAAIADTGDGENMKIGGYAVRYMSPSVPIGGSRYGFIEQIERGAFDDHLSTGADVFAFWSHDSGKILGSRASGTLTLNSDDQGLSFELDIADTSDGVDAYKLIRAGIVTSMSFGFRALETQWTWSDEDDEELDQRVIKRAEIFEISPVPFAAYPETEVDARHVRAAIEERDARNPRRVASIARMRSRSRRMRADEIERIAR